MYFEREEVQLQTKQQTARAHSTDPVAGWMELMDEWDTLCAELEHARAQAAGDREAAILARRQALEKRINTFLGAATRLRQPINGPLVMGTLVTGSGEAPATNSRRSSGKETD